MPACPICLGDHDPVDCSVTVTGPIADRVPKRHSFAELNAVTVSFADLVTLADPDAEC